MNRISPLIWISIVLIVLLPTAAGRFIVDIAGGLLILFILAPIFLGIAGWIGWKLIQSKMTKCENCGASFINNTNQCPFCGSSILSPKEQNQKSINEPASSATIDIKPS